MTIKEMHYDFKKKLNKVDSQQYKNFLIPEIDWVLNEAQEIFVKRIAKPRKRSYTGFELSQRATDDIRTLVVNNRCLDIDGNIVTLPKDYWNFIKADIEISKGGCNGVKARFHVRQYDDEFENSPFDKSSFEWRVVNGLFFKDGIQLYTDGTFENEVFCISYIKKPKYIHNAEDFKNKNYILPSGVTLRGSVDSELPEHTHREIVDIAVLITSGEIQSPGYNTNLQKINFNG